MTKTEQSYFAQSLPVALFEPTRTEPKLTEVIARERVPQNLEVCSVNKEQAIQVFPPVTPQYS